MIERNTEWGMRDLIVSFRAKFRPVHSPLRVALQRPTLRTLKTACGSHHSSKTSSGLNTGAFELEAGGASASVKIDELMRTRAEDGTSESLDLGLKWKEYGKGSSSWRLVVLSGS